jgi:hypothetical protein
MQLKATGDQRVKYIKYTNIWAVSGLYLNFTIKYTTGQDSVVGISTTLRAERSEDRIPVGARFSALDQTGPEAHTASYTTGTGSLSGVDRPGRGVDHPPHTAPRFKKK